MASHRNKQIKNKTRKTNIDIERGKANSSKGSWFFLIVILKSRLFFFIRIALHPTGRKE